MKERNYIFSQLNIVNVSEAVKEISPDMGYFWRTVITKNGKTVKTAGNRDRKYWMAITVTEAEVKNDDQYRLVVHYDKDGRKNVWECTISPADYKKWKQYFNSDVRKPNRKQTADAVTEEDTEKDYKLLMVKRRLLLLNDLLIKNRAPFRMREYQAKDTICLRVTKRLYDELSKGADECNMNLSQYCISILDGKRPKAALTDEELELMKNVKTLRSDYQLMENAIYNQLKGLTRDEIFAKVIEGKEFDFWRRFLLASKSVIDDLIINRHITDAAVMDYINKMTK